MIEPSKPANETQRLCALYALRVLDTPPEERFDRITRIAQKLFGVPIALVSLVDADRQWFKSRVGLAASETPRNISFCGHAILQSGPFVIPDATQDIRFRDNPLVTSEPSIRFYAGQPISDVEGNKLGTLCLVDRQPHQLDDAQLQLLRDLASWVENELNVESINQLLQRQHDSEQRFRAIFDTVVDGIVTINDQGLIETFNPAAQRIFGYRAEEVTGRNVNILMPEPYHGEHDGYLANYRRSGVRKIIGIGREVVGRRKDGSTFPLELAVSEMTVSNHRMFTGIVRDITERKKIERMQTEFVSTVSHELRTPLTSIRGSLGLVAGGVAGDVSTKARQLVDIAYKNCERLVNLINDILDSEKIASGKMNFEKKPIELMSLVQQAVEANHAYAVQHEAEIVLADILPATKVIADPDRLMQVLNNLLSNAAKFSPPEGKVTVSVQHLSGNIRVSVNDQGAGIPPEFHNRIFQRFAQADSSDTRQKGGTGLGLSITKAIIEKMGGKIDFVSESGKGTTFYFDLPEQIEIMPAKQTAGAAKPRVLIVEDDPDVATLLRMMLESGNLDVEVCHSAEQAKACLSRGKYDVITVDIQLPGQDGISLIRELRANERIRDLPIIVVSAKADENREAISGNAFEILDWLNKPIDQERLLFAVNQAASRAGSRKPSVLHIEDDPDVRHIVSDLLGNEAEVVGAASLHEARAALKNRPYDLIILDISLPDGSGIEILSDIHLARLSIPIMVFSAFEFDNTAANIVAAALVKSRTSNKELVQTIKSLLRQPSASDRPDIAQPASAKQKSS